MKLIVPVIALALLLACVAPAQAAKRAKTTVTFDAITYKDPETTYSGKVESDKKACKEGRKIMVFRVRDGADKKIGTGKPFNWMSIFVWQYEEDKPPVEGVYYAKAAKTKKCKADKSPDLVYLR